MSSSNVYQRQPRQERRRTERALIVDGGAQPPKPVTNPDVKPSAHARRSLQVFAIVVIFMLILLYFSTKFVAYKWSKVDTGYQPLPPVEPPPTAVLSEAAPVPPLVLPTVTTVQPASTTRPLDSLSRAEVVPEIGRAHV